MISRMKYSKYGIAKFLGHLDVVRYFQKAIRRSGLEPAYSAGFNPHQLLYFAAPLGLGQTSDAEYMDVEWKTEYTAEEIKERLNAVMSEGFEIQSVTILADRLPNQKKESIMSLAACADYMVSVKDMPVEQDGIQKEYAEWFSGIWEEKITEYCSRDTIMAEKATKKNTKMVNIKPMIFAFGFTPEAIQTDMAGQEEIVQTDIMRQGEKIIPADKINEKVKISHADSYQNGLRVFFKLANGSTENLKPELIMESFCKEYGIPYQQSALQFHRLETYCDLSLRNLTPEEIREALASKTLKHQFVPLSEPGRIW